MPNGREQRVDGLDEWGRVFQVLPQPEIVPDFTSTEHEGTRAARARQMRDGTDAVIFVPTKKRAAVVSRGLRWPRARYAPQTWRRSESDGRQRPS